MLVKYKGGQSAMTFSIGGRLMRLLPDNAVLLTKAQANDLQSRPFTKRLVKSKQLEFKGLDSLSKDELLALAIANSHKVSGKEKVADLIEILQDADDEDIAGAGDLDPDLGNEDLDPAE